MKKIILAIFASVMCLNADITLIKKLIDNDIDTDQYQLFITNTANVDIKGLEPKEVFNGTIQEYHERFANQNIPEILKEYKNEIDAEVEFKGYAKVIYALNDVAKPNDGEYIKIIDYYKNNALKTRLVKYLVSVDELGKNEQELIFNSTNDVSYHYNEGQIHAIFTTKRELDKFNKEQKQ